MILSALSALREIANTKKHFLATKIGKMKSGVAAYKYIKTKLNPLENDEEIENAKALANLNSLKLNTMKSGSCEKFITLFERRVSEVIEAAPAQSMIYTDIYKKMLLLGKIKPTEYATITVKSKTQLRGFICGPATKCGDILTQQHLCA